MGDAATVLGVAGRDQPPAMREFVDRHELGHVRHLVDDDGSLWSHFGVPGQPAWVLIDTDGHLVERLFGPVDPAALRERLRQLAP